MERGLSPLTKSPRYVAKSKRLEYRTHWIVCAKTIFVPNDYFPLASDANPAAQPIYDTFIESLQSYLNASIDTRSFADIWNSSGTMQEVQQTIPLFLNETYATLIGYYQVSLIHRGWSRRSDRVFLVTRGNSGQTLASPGLKITPLSTMGELRSSTPSPLSDGHTADRGARQVIKKNFEGRMCSRTFSQPMC